MRIPAIIRHDDAPQRYSRAAVALHWLTAIFIVGGATLGLSMVDLPLSRQKFQWYAWHKWIGITIFLLTCARLAWRLRRPAPPQLERMPVWQRQAASGTHAARELVRKLQRRNAMGNVVSRRYAGRGTARKMFETLSPRSSR